MSKEKLTDEQIIEIWEHCQSENCDSCLSNKLGTYSEFCIDNEDILNLINRLKEENAKLKAKNAKLKAKNEKLKQTCEKVKEVAMKSIEEATYKSLHNLYQEQQKASKKTAEKILNELYHREELGFETIKWYAKEYWGIDIKENENEC